MKAAYLLDQGINILNASDAYRDLAKPVLDAAGNIREWIIPRGAIVEGDEALFRVSTGQASPADEECAEACGMSPGQLQAIQRAYLGDMAGIRGKKDRELFLAGVIDGYGPGNTDEKPVYVPGANYQKWLDAKAAAQASKDEDI